MTTRAIVTDIEGTTSAISFVHDVLFPYASRELPGFIRQNSEDATVAALKLDAGEGFDWSLLRDRRGWIQVVAGTGAAAGIGFEPGDALAIDDVEGLHLRVTTDAEFLLFDLPGVPAPA